MNSWQKIASCVLCAAVLLPSLSACSEGSGETQSSSQPKNETSLVAVVSMLPNTNDVPAKESPLAKEEFIFGNVFFDKAATVVELSDTTIDSFEPLVDCPYLQTVTISDCKILSYSGLGSLTQISNLTISGCEFDNLSYVSDLIQLKSLDISNNGITDIIKLSSLKNLNSLMVTGGDVKGLGAVKYMPKLQVLKIDCPSNDDLTPLSELTDMRELYISSKKVIVF